MSSLHQLTTGISSCGLALNEVVRIRLIRKHDRHYPFSTEYGRRRTI